MNEIYQMSFQENIADVNSLIDLGKYQEAIDKVRTLYEFQNLSEENLNELDRLQCVILSKKGDYKDAIELASELIQKYAESTQIRNEIELSVIKISALVFSGALDDALNMIEEVLTKLEMCKDLPSNFRYEKTARLKNLYGITKQTQGDTVIALKSFQEGLEIADRFDNPTILFNLVNNTGLIFLLQGELDIALTYLERALHIAEILHNKEIDAVLFDNIAEIYVKKGDYESAFEKYTQSISISEEVDSELIQAICLYDMIKFLVQFDHLEETKPYQDKLDELASRNPQKIIQQLKMITKGLILSTNPRNIPQAEAQKIFREVVDAPVLNQDYSSFAMLNLCYILLNELKTTGELEIFKEVKTLVEKLLILGKEQQSSLLIAETLWLKSKIALLEFDIKQAQALMTEAQQIATEKGFKKLAFIVSEDYDLLLSQMANWETFINQNATIEDRLELAQMEKILVQFLHKRVENIQEMPEEPILLLVLREGLPIISNTYSKDLILDEMLIGGFLTAINSFASEAFSTKESIDRIKQKDFTIALKKLDEILICYVFKGPSFGALQKMDLFITHIKESDMIKEIKTQDCSDSTSEVCKKVGKLANQIFGLQ